MTLSISDIESLYIEIKANGGLPPKHMLAAA